jgi:glycosyltransferase involved in cell wall biosynthesis
MIKVLVIPSSDYLGHPFPQRHNQIFERLNSMDSFEVHVTRFKFFDNPLMKTTLKVHLISDTLNEGSIALYYLANAANHALQIRKIVQQEGIDLLILSNIAAPLVYTLMDEISGIGIPIVVDLPDYFPTSATGYVSETGSLLGRVISGSLDLMLRRIIKHADLVTVVSGALKNYAIHAGGRWVEKVQNGISDDFLTLYDDNSLRSKLGFEADDFVIGYIGSMEFWLEMQPLISAVGTAVQKGLPAKLFLVGKSLHTGFIDKVEKQIGKEGISDHVIWHDFVPYHEVPSYLSVIDIGTIPFNVLNPTAFYSSPNKIWEYLSQKKPVVSTPIPEAINNKNYISLASTPEDYYNIFLKTRHQDKTLYDKTQVGHVVSRSKTWESSTQYLALLLEKLVANKKRNLTRS